MDELFEAILMLGKMLGLSRSVATVFAVLYSRDDALSVEELVDLTGLSKSAVSLAVRDLIQMGVVHEKIIVGERCRRYAGLPDLACAATEMALARLKSPLSELRQRLDNAAGSSARWQQARALLATVDDTLAAIQIES